MGAPRARYRGEYIRFLIVLAVLIVVTLIEVRTLSSMVSPLYISLSVVAYLLFVPVFVVVATLWREIRLSITDILAKPREEKFVTLSTVARSVALYSISRSKPVTRILSPLITALARYSEEAAVALDPLNTATLFLIVSAAASISMAVLCHYILSLSFSLSLALAVLIFVAILFSPLIALELLVSSRRSSIRVELPFFMLYSSLVEKAGRSLASAFERVAQQAQIFRRMSREALNFLKIATFFVPSPLKALEVYASTVPSRELRSVVQDYLSIAKTGGNTSRFLESEAEQLVQLHSAEWSSYVEKVGFFGDILIVFYVLLPSIMVLGAIAFSQGMSAIMLEIFTYAITPLITVATYLIIDTMQPKHPSTQILTDVDKVIIGVCSFMGIAVVFLLWKRLSLDPSLTMGLAFLAALLPLLGIYMIRGSEVANVERDLPRFLRDIAEALRVGYTFSQAVPRIAVSRHYNRFLDRYVSALAVLLQLNIPISRLQRGINTRSWLFNYSLFILCELESLGALSPREVELLAKFIESVENSKRRARGALTFYSLLFILAPIFVLVLAMLAQSMLSSVSVGGVTQFINIGLVKQIVSYSKNLAVILALSLGVLAGKIRDGTGLNALYAVAALSIVCLALAGWSQLSKIFSLI